VAAIPPMQTECTLGSHNTSPVLASQDLVGLITLPLPGHAQLGLQQSQYPVVHVPVIHCPRSGFGVTMDVVLVAMDAVVVVVVTKGARNPDVV